MLEDKILLTPKKNIVIKQNQGRDGNFYFLLNKDFKAITALDENFTWLETQEDNDIFKVPTVHTPWSIQDVITSDWVHLSGEEDYDWNIEVPRKTFSTVKELLNLLDEVYKQIGETKWLKK